MVILCGTGTALLSSLMPSLSPNFRLVHYLDVLLSLLRPSTCDGPFLISISAHGEKGKKVEGLDLAQSRIDQSVLVLMPGNPPRHDPFHSTANPIQPTSYFHSQMTQSDVQCLFRTTSLLAFHSAWLALVRNTLQRDAPTATLVRLLNLELRHTNVLAR